MAHRVKLLDANVLVQAYHAGTPNHDRVRRWLENAFWAQEPVGASWLTLLAFLRITTHRSALTHPMTAAEAMRCVDSWFDDGGLRIVEPTDRHWATLQELLMRSGARGNLIMDADLAALALTHGATLCTCDADFARFKGVELENPLETSN
jgi:toxin-antitoxin system PIN domain toxin